MPPRETAAARAARLAAEAEAAKAMPVDEEDFQDAPVTPPPRDSSPQGYIGTPPAESTPSRTPIAEAIKSLSMRKDRHPGVKFLDLGGGYRVCHITDITTGLTHCVGREHFVHSTTWSALLRSGGFEEGMVEPIGYTLIATAFERANYSWGFTYIDNDKLVVPIKPAVEIDTFWPMPKLDLGKVQVPGTTQWEDDEVNFVVRDRVRAMMRMEKGKAKKELGKVQQDLAKKDLSFKMGDVSLFRGEKAKRKSKKPSTASSSKSVGDAMEQD